LARKIKITRNKIFLAAKRIAVKSRKSVLLFAETLADKAQLDQLKKKTTSLTSRVLREDNSPVLT
jgi:hypothetical protein